MTILRVSRAILISALFLLLSANAQLLASSHNEGSDARACESIGSKQGARLIVVFHDYVVLAHRKSIIARMNGRIVSSRVFATAPPIHFYVVEVIKGCEKEILEAFQNLLEVRDARPDLLSRHD